MVGYFFGTVDFDPTDAVDNHTAVGGNNIFITKLTGIDLPNLLEVTAVTSPSSTVTPAHTFFTSDAGSITYGGLCASTTVSAVYGENTVIFNALADGTYANCTITVTNAVGKVSVPLAVSPFTIDTIAPPAAVITSPAQNIISNSATPVISGTAEANASVSIKDGANVLGLVTATGGNWSLGGGGTVLADGAHAFTATATDAAGNTGLSSTVTTYTVDTTAPVFTGLPLAMITAEATGSNTTVILTPPTANDLFPVTITHDAPATFPVGTTVVTWTATDANGNVSTTTQDVLVQDTVLPVISGLPLADIIFEATNYGSVVTLIPPTATDLFPVTVTHNAPAFFSVGTTTVTWTATDDNGNASTTTQNVVVSDTIVPVFTGLPLAPVTVEATGAGTNVYVATPTATDLFPVVITHNKPATYPVGTTVVTWTATDANGNVSTTTQGVVVQDTTAPVFRDLPLPDLIVDATGDQTPLTLIPPVVSDLFAVTTTHDAAATFPVGTTTVTWTATDIHGNTTTAAQYVKVQAGTGSGGDGSNNDITVNGDVNTNNSASCLVPAGEHMDYMLLILGLLALGTLRIRYKSRGQYL